MEYEKCKIATLNCKPPKMGDIKSFLITCITINQQL